MGSSSREDEAARVLERGGGIKKMDGGSGSHSRKKMAKAVSQKYAFVAGTHVPSGARGVLGWQASWAVHYGCAAWAVNESGEVGLRVEKGERARPGRPARPKWKKVWVHV
jgi:hypothetical protein